MNKTNRPNKPTYEELEDVFRPEEYTAPVESTTKTGVVTNCKVLT